MISLLIARSDGPAASELTAPERVAWARHLDRLPPASVAIARATRLILLALGADPEMVDRCLWWGRMPTLAGYPAPAVSDDDPGGGSLEDMVARASENVS